MSTNASGSLEQSNTLHNGSRVTSPTYRKKDERQETDSSVQSSEAQIPIISRTFSEFSFKKSDNYGLRMKKDSFLENVNRSNKVHSRPQQITLSRVKSLPGMLQLNTCHCAACCSCSPDQQKCFIPPLSLSRTVLSLSDGLDAESREPELLQFCPEMQCNGVNAKAENHDTDVASGTCDKFDKRLDYPLSDSSHSITSENGSLSQAFLSGTNRGFAQLSEGSKSVSKFCSTSKLKECKSTFCQYCHCEKFSKEGNLQPTTSAKSLMDFKQKLQLMRNWFKEFDDGQKNLTLQALLEEGNASQKHLLATKLEFYSHDECQPNCRDYIGWLPDTVSFLIFSYLDPVSLCRASCVSQRWYQIASDPSLWRHLSMFMKWRLSQTSEHKQLVSFKMQDGNVNWKQLFSERFRLQNNWIRGRCNIRTFEGHTQGVSCLQFDENRIVSGSSDKTIKLWNIRTNSQWAVQTLVGHSGTVRCLHLDGNRLVSGSTDRTIKVWDLSYQESWASIACKVTMVGHIDTVRCLKVDADKVISGSYDKTLKVWDIKTGSCRQTLRGHEAAVLCVQFDSSKIISGSCDKTIKVWTFEGECVMTLQGHQDAVTCLQFDDRRIISGSLDCTLRFWNVVNGHLISTIDWKASEGHTRVIRCLQADSWRVVSASDDKTIKVWSLETGQRLVTLRNHTDGVTCLQFNDSILVSGSYDKTVKLWDFSCC